MQSSQTAEEIEVSKRRIIFVLGAPRSGTSLITHVVGTLVDGLPAHPLPANQVNEAGFWEPAEIVSLHEELLSQIGTRWRDPGVWDLGQASPTQRGSLKRQLWKAIARNYGTSRTIVLKDPRISRLLPIWLEIAEENDLDPVCVLAVRHPMEVARSIDYRWMHPQNTGLLIWSKYMIEAENFSRNVKRGFVSYDLIVRNWREGIGQVAALLKVNYESLPTEHLASLDAISRESLRNFKATEADEQIGLPPTVERIYALAVSAAETGNVDIGAFSALAHSISALIADFSILNDDRLQKSAAVQPNVSPSTEFEALIGTLTIAEQNAYQRYEILRQSLDHLIERGNAELQQRLDATEGELRDLRRYAVERLAKHTLLDRGAMRLKSRLALLKSAGSISDLQIAELVRWLKIEDRDVG